MENLALNPPTSDEVLEADWQALKATEPKFPQVIPRMTEDEIRDFVVRFLRGEIFTSAQVRDLSVLEFVFMPLALVMADVSEATLRDIGVIYAPLSSSLPRSVNGYPCLTSVAFMHKDDWARASAAIVREQAREASIEV